MVSVTIFSTASGSGTLRNHRLVWAREHVTDIEGTAVGVLQSVVVKLGVAVAAPDHGLLEERRGAIVNGQRRAMEEVNSAPNAEKLFGLMYG